MRKYTLNIYKDLEEASRAAANEVVTVLQRAIFERDRATLALSGGSTPKRLYELLAGDPFRGKVDWPKVHFFWGDERPVPPDHPQSNYRMAKEALLGPLQIADDHIHRLKGEERDRNAAAEAYQNEIAAVLGVSAIGEPPVLDVTLLGLGEDGHTASLFPATPALLETQQWVVNNPVLKLDCDRLTMTPMLINRSANIFFLVSGSQKAKPLAAVLEGPVDTQRLPAQLIRPARGKLIWFVDKDAATGLSKQQKG